MLDMFSGSSMDADTASRRRPTRALGFAGERLEERRVMATLDYVDTTGVLTLTLGPDDDVTMTVTGGDFIRFTDDSDNPIALTGAAGSFFTASNTFGSGSLDSVTANAAPDASGFRQIRVLAVAAGETFTIGDVSDEELPGLFVDGSVDTTVFNTSLLDTLDISSNSVVVRSPEIVLL